MANDWDPGFNQYADIHGTEFDEPVNGYVGGVDIVGLARRMGTTPATALAAVRQGRVPGLGPNQRIGQNTPDVARTQISPMPSATITANATITLTWQPQRPFRLERLFLQSTGNNTDFVVEALTVGADPQFVNDGAIPGTMFAFNAVGAHLRGNTANPGVTLSIQLRNLTGGTIQIAGGIIGTSLTG